MHDGKKGNKIVLVGATGLVGSAILGCLERLDLAVDELVLTASERSDGKIATFRGHSFEIKKFDPSVFSGARYVFFSGKDGLSEEFCPVAADAGAWVIDNSAAFRMDPSVPLVVPEINMHAVPETPGLIANPNCSTIQLALPLARFHKTFGLKKVIVSTYQSASGAGGAYVNQLRDDSLKLLSSGSENPGFDSLAFNCIPAVGSPAENGRFSEETKLENELVKILEIKDLLVCATAVRVPTMVSHAESVVIGTKKKIDPDHARRILSDAEGIALMDDFESRQFPTPRQAEGTDPAWVGRIRTAGIFKNDLAFWVVADNLLKGAALNAVQIAVALQKRSG